MRFALWIGAMVSGIALIAVGVNGSAVAGGTATQAPEQVYGHPVAISNGSSASLTWDVKTAGPNLLNLSAPSAPRVVTSGIYAVSVSAVTDYNMTAGGNFLAVLTLDASGAAPQTASESAPANALLPGPLLSLSETSYIPAGGTISLTVGSWDGAQDGSFALSTAVVQKVG